MQSALRAASPANRYFRVYNAVYSGGILLSRMFGLFRHLQQYISGNDHDHGIHDLLGHFPVIRLLIHQLPDQRFHQRFYQGFIVFVF